MDKCYEDIKKELELVSSVHTKQNQEKRVHGERVRFPADDEEIEAIIYRYDREAPTVFTAFGGGFIMGGCALDDHMWTMISKEAKVNIISVGYRRTPKYHFPTACNDIYHAIKWFCSHEEEYNINSEKLQ